MVRAGILGLLLALALAACRGSESTPVHAPDAETYAAPLREAGLPVRVQELPDLRETPGCPPAETRFRLHFGPAEFVNVSRFSTPDEAEACWAEYREVVSRGGQASWDRLAPLAVLEGRHLLLFPDTVADPARRARIVELLPLAH